ncbi:sodium-dependent transporter [candidate division KSB1 bacterium]|nr:sodium-dependent transporter [candidate division KSB1 bacterium]
MEKKEYFTSRWALILAALGMAIGTGNIWRFPRITAQNGGAAFLIPWIIFLFIWSIPLLITELTFGKSTRLGTVGAFGKLVGKKHTWMGGFVGICSMAIMFYYSVVMGWCVKYFVASISGGLGNINGLEYWTEFTGAKFQPILFHFISITIGAFIIYLGVVKGIEKANKILLPALIILILIGAVRALTLPGAVKGLNFLFNPEWGRLLDYKVWLNALTQSAWSTGAGWGLLLTYGVYAKKDEDLVLNSCITGLGNNSASLLVGFMIFPAVFSIAPQLGLAPEQVIAEVGPANTGLAFIWIPNLFAHFPGGNIFTALFFLALSFAALSSLVAMIEMVTRNFMDLGLKRQWAIAMVWIGGFILGFPSAISLGFFGNQDWAWGVGLMVSGFFFAVAVMIYGAKKFRQELINQAGNDLNVGKWYEYFIKYIIPLEFVVLIVWWFWQSVIWSPATWWNPFSAYSLGTCLFQWGVIILLLLLFNNLIYKRIFKTERN